MKKIYVLISSLVFGFSTFAQTKHVVIEEHTGTWCQWCPGGTYYMDSLAHSNPNIIAIAGHSNDPMEYSAYLSQLGLSSAPSAHIDRGNQAASINAWFYEVNQAFNNTPVADVEVFQTFNSANRELSVRVKATFFSTITGTYKLGGMITEDAVHGTDPDYDQSNAYQNGNNGNMGGFQTFSGNVPANQISYNHVARQMLGGFTGQANTVPASVQPGDTASYTFTFTLPSDWNENYIRSVGFLFDANDQMDNAGKSTYLNGTSNVPPVFLSEPITEGYENSFYRFGVFANDPNDKNLTITATTIPSWLTLSPTTQLGYIHSKAMLEGTPTTAGTYPVVLEVSDGNLTTTMSYDIVVNPALPGNWILVGNEGFTANNSIIDLASDKDGTLYALLDNGVSTEVYQKTQTGSWSQLGNLGSSDYYGGIKIGSDGLTPYVAIGGSNGIVVKKYESNTWFSIGGSVGAGVQIGFDLDANDQPYVAFQDGSISYAGGCYTYDGNSWILVGGTSFSNGKPAVWNDLTVNKTTGDVYVLWTDFNGGRKAYTTKWDGSTWADVGNSAVSNKSVAFEQKIAIHPYTNNPYVALVTGSGTSGNLDVFEYDGSAWKTLGSDISSGLTYGIDAAFNESGVYLVSFEDLSYSNTISVMREKNGSWEFVGPRGFTNGAASRSEITTYNNSPYVLYQDDALNGKASVRYYDFSIVGVESIVHAEQFAYPNPATDFIYVKDIEKPTNAKIFNLQGKLVWNGTIRPNQPIWIGNLATGIYVLDMSNKKTKVVIQH